MFFLVLQLVFLKQWPNSKSSVCLLSSAGKKFSADESLYSPRFSADVPSVDTLHFRLLPMVCFPQVTAPFCFTFVPPWLCNSLVKRRGDTLLRATPRGLKTSPVVGSNGGEGDCQLEREETLGRRRSSSAHMQKPSTGLVWAGVAPQVPRYAFRRPADSPPQPTTRLFQLSRGVALRALFLQKRTALLPAASLGLEASPLAGGLPTGTRTQTFIYNCCYSIIELCSYKPHGSSNERLRP